MSATTLEKSNVETSSVLMTSELQQQDVVLANTSQPQHFCFTYRFTDTMPMAAKIETVSKYLDTHQGWFTRCAHPMRVEAIGQNGYAITIGKFDSCGYVVEPKVGLELLPQDSGVYRIKTISIPDYTPPGYEVAFNAKMRLLETLLDSTLGTKVEWDLDLSVYIQFPKFIHKLPKKVIQGTGDKLLKQIVTQVSRRLTHKVQQDFHGNLGLKIPKR